VEHKRRYDEDLKTNSLKGKYAFEFCVFISTKTKAINNYSQYLKKKTEIK